MSHGRRDRRELQHTTTATAGSSPAAPVQQAATQRLRRTPPAAAAATTTTTTTTTNANTTNTTTNGPERARSSNVPAKRKASLDADADADDDDDDGTNGSAAAKGRKRVPAEIWETKRPIITRLYQEEKKSLKEVMEIMERTYHFTATVKMYKSRIWKWGLDKKLKGDEVLAILWLQRERENLRRPSEFRIRGQLVDLENINRYLKRNPALMQKYRSGQRPSIQTNLEVECRTPSPSPTRMLSAPEEMRNTEKLLGLFRDYVDGSFSAGAWNCVYNVDCVSRGTVKDRSNDVFERVIASFALVNRCMSRGDTFSIPDMLNPSFESLKELLASQSPVFLVRTVCLLWYLERHHKNDLLRMVINFLGELAVIRLPPNHIAARIWPLLHSADFSDYYELSMRLYALLLPLLEDRIGPANYLTHILYEDYMDCIYAKKGPEDCEAVMRQHREKAEQTGMAHPWLRELAMSHAALIAAVRERQGRLSDAVQTLANFMRSYPVRNEHAASLYMEMGVYSYKLGNTWKAISYAKKAARLALTSDADERVSITVLANLERFMREAGEKSDAELVLAYRMQLLATFAERSVSLASEDGSEDDDDDDDDAVYEWETAAFELEHLPDWLQPTPDDEDEFTWYSMVAPEPALLQPYQSLTFEWTDAATTKAASSDCYSVSLSADTSRRSSYVPPNLIPPGFAHAHAHAVPVGAVSPQPYSPFVPPVISPQPEHMSRSSSFVTSQPAPPPPPPPPPPPQQQQPGLSPRPPNGATTSPYYQPGLSPQPGTPPPPYGPGLSPQPERTSPYFVPGLSPQPEKRSPYYVPSPPQLHLDQSIAYDLRR